MKKILPTIIAVGIFIGFFMYYQHFNKQKTIQNDNNLLIWEEDQNRITSISILNENETISLKRNGNSWDITSPINYPANSFYISQLLSGFSSPNANQLVEETPKDLSTYGLDAPSKSITLSTDSGISNTLSCGDTAPLSKGYYVLDNNTNKVYTMGNLLWDKILLDLNSLRDKAVLSFDERYVNRIVIKNEEQSYTISSKEEKGVTNWYSDSNLLDEGSVRSLITALSRKSIEEFVVDNVNDNDLKKYGLKDPKFTITIYLNDKNSSTLVLYIGNIEDDMAYVTTDKQFIYKVNASSMLPKDLSIDHFKATNSKK